MERTLLKKGVLILFVVSLVLVSCKVEVKGPSSGDEDEDETTDDRGGAVGFVTGDESEGTVPVDGTSEDAPQITDVTIEVVEIEEGEPLSVTVSFDDAGGDLETVHFGIEGEDTYYSVSISGLVDGASSGSVLLELFPKRYVPGHYSLLVSLEDEAGNVSALAKVPFTILDPDGTPPDGEDTEKGSDTGEGDTGDGPSDGPSFIIGYMGDGALDEPPALQLVTPVGGEASIQTLTEVVPNYLNGYVHDYKAGRLAYVAAAEFRVEGRGPIAVLDVDNPAGVQWVPVPQSADEDFYYDVPEARPQVLSDGRIVYKVVYNTANVYDDFHEDQFALWDPETDELRLQGGLSEWHRSQPEVEACNPDCDMEGGYQAGAFAVSPDDRYVYHHIIGMGVDMMIVHTGYSYFARWDTVTGTTERLEFLDSKAEVWTVTGDNAYVVLSHDGQWKKWDIASISLSAFDDYPTTVRVGQTSQTGPKIMKGWRQCGDAYGGVVIFDLAADTGVRIIDPALYEDPRKGISENVQMNRDASEVYFTASVDACTNYRLEIAVMKSPAVENNPEPELMMTLSGLYDYGFFMVLN